MDCTQPQPRELYTNFICGIYDYGINHYLKNWHQQFVMQMFNRYKKSGIHDAVSWIANHYQVGTSITLLGRPIPKLNDAKSWEFWKYDLLHYYDKRALNDAARFIHCATKNF
ncbi:unnamed protein product [Didymodactylos carnosus]|uniref:Uncharacterized protein n=1 Tax=Didymodactylos carnosus TaxID=1234261 RepID=A0A813WJT4_9BILA|nr:unnamed protein product [Didymodactylos carnosus]CAF0855975.1 unnamed protein product [Didymodactylos carnosus]CAF3531711.1 unnamed protein product [Didymodactylos carnosus]CAF3643742.1 unnamed protein product [Didymodactylos carnosus]